MHLCIFSMLIDFPCRVRKKNYVQIYDTVKLFVNKKMITWKNSESIIVKLFLNKNNNLEKIVKVSAPFLKKTQSYIIFHLPFKIYQIPFSNGGKSDLAPP